ncbi:MAG: glutamine synthetase family protein [Pseudomonadota bacterium]
MAADFTKLPEGTHTVAMGTGDMNGVMRGKRIPASHWPTICKNGNAMSIATFAIDMTCDVWDTPYVNFDNGYPDMHLFPCSEPVPVPWEEGVAFCIGRTEGMDHKPVPIDPRGALVDQVERAASMGYTVNVGTELEFYLLDPETKQPRDSGIQVYSLARAAELEHVLGPIRSQINEMGIPIEQSNPEYAAGQVEVNIRFDEALLAADRVIMFRNLVKELAQAHGYIATFMAKPLALESGNGFHTHHSLWKDGANVFSDGGKLSAAGRSYLAGMQSRMAETALASATTPNAYRRRQPYTFCPINTCWGIDNRTVGLRVIEGSDSSTRVEKRDGSADCNPYYHIACELAAGLDGMENNLEPTPMCEGNGYELEDAEPIPADLGTAVELARNSEFMKSVIGEDRLAILIQQAERELGFIEEYHASNLCPVESERYLTNL